MVPDLPWEPEMERWVIAKGKAKGRWEEGGAIMVSGGEGYGTACLQRVSREEGG